nr:DNA methyltransferase [Acidibrevibacterium fodinaquatile]
MFDMWLACYTQEEIAEAEGAAVGTVNSVCSEMADLPESDKPAASHLTDFDPPLYNVWKQQTRTPGSAHFGNSEARWVDNLLYLYTQPFDVVVDPFAGGGSTIDVCRKRFRRYWVSDRKPIVEREKEIRANLSGLAVGSAASWRAGHRRLGWLSGSASISARNRAASSQARSRSSRGVIGSLLFRVSRREIIALRVPGPRSAERL